MLYAAALRKLNIDHVFLLSGNDYTANEKNFKCIANSFFSFSERSWLHELSDSNNKKIKFIPGLIADIETQNHYAQQFSSRYHVNFGQSLLKIRSKCFSQIQSVTFENENKLIWV